MKRISLFLLLFVLTPSAFPQWNANGKVIPDEPWRKSAGKFAAMLLLSDEPQKFMEDWEKPETPHISTTDRAERGKPVVAFVVFLGCQESAGSCNSEVDFKVLRPDGTEYGGEEGVELWKNKPAPPPNVMQLSVANLGIVIEPNDPAGRYTVKAKVFDRNARKSVELLQHFEVTTPPN